jgi:hypothetical protein
LRPSSTPPSTSKKINTDRLTGGSGQSRLAAANRLKPGKNPAFLRFSALRHRGCND